MTVKMTNPVDHFTAIPLGVTAVVTPRSLSMPVLTTLVNEAAIGGRGLSLRFPAGAKVVVLVPGAERQVQQYRAVLAGNQLPGDVPPIHFVPIGFRKDFNFIGQEGLFLLHTRLLKERSKPELWIFTVAIGNLEDPLFIDGIRRLSEMAKAAKCWLVPVIEHDDKEPPDLSNFVDECAIVRSCEPDVDGGVAFSFDCQSHQGLTSFGLGKVMCTLKYGQDYRYERTFAPFVAKTLRNRAIRILSGIGYSGNEIAAIVSRDKSNVSRQLEGWHPLKLEMPEGWVERIREHFASDVQVPEVAAKKKVRTATAAEIEADHDDAQRRMDESEDLREDSEDE